MVVDEKFGLLFFGPAHPGSEFLRSGGQTAHGQKGFVILRAGRVHPSAYHGTSRGTFEGIWSFKRWVPS